MEDSLTILITIDSEVINPMAGSLVGPKNIIIPINKGSIIPILIVLTIINVFIVGKVGIHPRYVGIEGKINVLKCSRLGHK